MFVHMKNFHTMSETACETLNFKQDDTRYTYECFWKRVYSCYNTNVIQDNSSVIDHHSNSDLFTRLAHQLEMQMTLFSKFCENGSWWWNMKLLISTTVETMRIHWFSIPIESQYNLLIQIRLHQILTCLISLASAFSWYGIEMVTNSSFEWNERARSIQY